MQQIDRVNHSIVIYDSEDSDIEVQEDLHIQTIWDRIIAQIPQNRHITELDYASWSDRLNVNPELSQNLERTKNKIYKCFLILFTFEAVAGVTLIINYLMNEEGLTQGDRKKYGYMGYSLAAMMLLQLYVVFVRKTLLNPASQQITYFSNKRKLQKKIDQVRSSLEQCWWPEDTSVDQKGVPLNQNRFKPMINLACQAFTLKNVSIILGLQNDELKQSLIPLIEKKIAFWDQHRLWKNDMEKQEWLRLLYR